MRTFSLIALAGLTTAASLRGGHHMTERSEPAPLILHARDSATAVADRYIVKFRGDAAPSAVQSAMSDLSGFSHVLHEYTSAGFRGFAGQLDGMAVEALRRLPAVDFIEQDQETVAVAAPAFTTDEEEEWIEQTDAVWSLGRMSSRDNSTISSFWYPSSAGEGTCAYVLDTGVFLEHDEFEGRASFGDNFSSDNFTTDGYGHGTHVSGTIIGRTYGLAKRARVISVKTLNANGGGLASDMVRGLDYVASDVEARAAAGECPNGFLVNMSVQFPPSPAMDDASASLVAQGVFVAVAAGNYAEDASGTSPGRTPEVCTVGASNGGDRAAYFSNYGPVLDVWAPGVNVKSAWIPSANGSETDATYRSDGTSMATPAVAGLAASLMASEGYGGRPVELLARIKELATKDAIKGGKNSTTLLAFNGNPLEL